MKIKPTTSVRITLAQRFFFLFLICLLSSLLTLEVKAQSQGGYSCKMLQSCALIPTGTTVIRHCNVTTHCTFVPNMSPPASNVNPPSMPSSQVSIPDNRARWCSQNNAQINQNHSKCMATAIGQHRSRVDACSRITDLSIQIGVDGKIVNGSISVSISPGPTCIARSTAIEKEAIAICELDRSKALTSISSDCY